MKDQACSYQLMRKAERERAPWIEQLRAMSEQFSVEQEDALVSRCLRSEARVPVHWVGVTIKRKGHTCVVCVGGDALSLIHPVGHVRVNVSGRGAQMLCDGLGLQMPTPLVVDTVWQHASQQIAPMTYLPDAKARVSIRTRAGQGKLVSMSSLDAMVAHSDRVGDAIKGAPDLVCNAGKWWVIDRRLAGQMGTYTPETPYKCANYGWFDEKAPGTSVTGMRLWQSVGTRHNQWHRDYSQTFVPVGRLVLLDGQVRTFADVLKDRELGWVLNHDGPIGFARHPNLPLFEHPDACDISPDPREVPNVGAYDPVEAPTRPNGAVLSKFVQARNYTPATDRKVSLVVIHTMEHPEKPGTAKAVANWFAGNSAPKASAHYCIDDADTVQCVQEKDVAWAAPGANRSGIQLEHAGYASQTPEEWGDVYSRCMLERSARLTARICERHGLPAEYVDADGLLQGRSGVTTHWQVTRACALAKARGLATSPFYRAHTTHTDPGPNFPMQAYLEAVRRYMEGS